MPCPAEMLNAEWPANAAAQAKSGHQHQLLLLMVMLLLQHQHQQQQQALLHDAAAVISTAVGVCPALPGSIGPRPAVVRVATPYHNASPHMITSAISHGMLPPTLEYIYCHMLASTVLVTKHFNHQRLGTDWLVELIVFSDSWR